MNQKFKLSSLCRFCLSKENVTIPIFEGGDSDDLLTKISACLPVSVYQDDKLPKRMCKNCLFKLHILHEFWSTSATSEKQFQDWFNQCDAKNQSIDNNSTSEIYNIQEVAEFDVENNDCYIKTEVMEQDDFENESQIEPSQEFSFCSTDPNISHNDECTTTDQSQMKTEIEWSDNPLVEKGIKSHTISNKMTKPAVIVDNNISTPESITISNNDNYSTNNVSVNTDLANKIQNLEEKVDALQKKIDNLADTLNTNTKEIKLIMQQLISVLSMNNENITLIPTIAENYEEEFRSLQAKFPIGTSEELFEMENQLIDENFKNIVVEYLSKFCGKSGTKTGSKICYTVFDEMFERAFATTCNWTGNTHEKDKKKIGFQSFPNIVRTFHSVICLANRQLSYNDAVDFLKKLFRNSGNRAKAEGGQKRKRLNDDENDL